MPECLMQAVIRALDEEQRLQARCRVEAPRTVDRRARILHGTRSVLDRWSRGSFSAEDAALRIDQLV